MIQPKAYINEFDTLVFTNMLGEKEGLIYEEFRPIQRALNRWAQKKRRIRI